MHDMREEKGFTIVELLIVVILIGMVLSVVMPISYGMYAGYSASLRAQEVMTYISGLRREAFLYGERKVLSSQEGDLTIDGHKKKFNGVRVVITEPVLFFPNGTSSGGVIELNTGEVVQNLIVDAPLGDLSLERRRI